MEAPTTLDLSAAARVAKRVELKEIRLSEINARNLSMAQGGPLHPEVQHVCSPTTREPHMIEVMCSYDFFVRSDGDDVAKAQFKYLISYDVIGDAPVDEHDLEHFAFANGTYHSWPFVRQLVFDLTSRMGYPPYTLPVFQFNPKPRAAESEATAPREQGNEAEGEPSDS